ncbi:MAG TPA: phBC6A51 family helix-turn-helix protein [Armatimonadota bacterium]|nr:phBC6A51 family helix-turn-helix protein [Armatimonadota bacterium]
MRNDAITPGAWRWNKQREHAAALVARDDLTDVEIANEVGIGKATLERWKAVPEFQARVEEHVTAFRALVRRRGIAVLENRIQAQQDRWERMQAVIHERAAEMDGEVAGGGSGLLVRQYKTVGSGDDAELVREYHVDTGLLRELRELEKQAAQELGQWTERQDLTSGGDRLGPISIYIPDNGRDNPGDGDGDPPAEGTPGSLPGHAR